MEVTKKLMDEHQLILSYIEELYRLIATWERETDSSDTSFTSLSTIIGFIQNYADKYHHAKEEDILFRFLEAPGVLNHCNPLPVMLEDHAIGRGHVSGMLQAIVARDKTRAIMHANAWAAHLSNHIHKEDNVLYVMAEEGLSVAAKKAITEEYTLAETKLDGSKLEEKYRKILAGFSAMA